MSKKKGPANPKTDVPATESPAKRAPEFPSLEEQIAAIPKPDPLPKRKSALVDGEPVATLADLAEAYLVHMHREGRSEGTVASYRMELRSAMAELDGETRLWEITPERVQAFFDSKRVTKLRSGKAKSQLSIDKTRRVLRLALLWAEERGIVEKAPLPEPATA